MHGAGAVKGRTVLWLWAVSQREYTSMGEWTHKHSITTPLFFSIHHLSRNLSLSPLTQRLTQTVMNACIMFESKYMSALFLNKELKKTHGEIKMKISGICLGLSAWAPLLG